VSAGRDRHTCRASSYVRRTASKTILVTVAMAALGMLAPPAARTAPTELRTAAAQPNTASPAVTATTGNLDTAHAERCESLLKHGRNAESHTCYQSLVRESSPYLRAEGFWGLAQYSDANEEFRTAVAQAPANALYKVRWGLMLHERFNDQDAQDLFKEALAKDPNSSQAYLGLALVSAGGFSDGAVEWARKALELNPQLAEAHELLATLALEDSDPNQAATEADAALKTSADALDALAVHASIELLADRSPDAWLSKLAAINPTYGKGYALIAHHLILSGRYVDGVAYYRKAIAADPQLWSARAELGINLMRLGQDAEARQQLQKCYQNGYRNGATVNSLRLLDSYKNFVVLKDGNTIVKLHKKESDLLYPYFLSELKRDIAAYEQKYHMKLSAPVQVEVYPDHEDFAVRTLGMPGLGALGVTFGNVVAMDSPSGRKPGDFHWASTLRHELSHVFILAATNHRVARWFTEGLAVHEETEASPEWGDPITPDILVALRDKKLLPVADLDRGFVRPKYPTQVLVSYFQAGQICDYIQSRWGAAKLLDMVHSYAHVVSAREVIQKNLGMGPEEFDKQFQAWLYGKWQSTLGTFDQWHERLANLVKLAHEKRYDAVIHEGDAVIRLYPSYVYDNNAYELLAAAQLAQGNKDAAAAVLEAYMKAGGRRPAALESLAQLQEAAGNPKAAAATLDRINFIDPAVDQDLHRRLGALWLAQKNYDGAIREYGAVVAFHPLDIAAAQYDLAHAYFEAGQRDKAEDAVLASLEAAPDYRPAQKLLLQLKSP
jgi:cellulose synthase operon protein C